MPIERGLGVISLASLIIKSRFSNDQPEDTGNPIALNTYKDIAQIGFTFLIAAISEGLVGTGTIFIICKLISRIFFKGYVHFYQKVGATTTNFGDKMRLEGVKGCQWILV